MSRETIREFSGRIIGYLDYESNGDITVRNFSNQILGYYWKRDDTTRDFSMRILYRGNMAAALLVLKQ